MSVSVTGKCWFGFGGIYGATTQLYTTEDTLGNVRPFKNKSCIKVLM